MLAELGICETVKREARTIAVLSEVVLPRGRTPVLGRGTRKGISELDGSLGGNEVRTWRLRDAKPRT